MKVTDLWKESSRPTFSFELFPAKTPKGAETLENTVDVLAGLKPAFVSVTFGAGGSTREGSRRLIERLGDEKGLNILAYFAGYGLSPHEIGSVLDSYSGLGVENLLVVRGDKPNEEGFIPHPECFAHASDLVAYIRPRYGFSLGVAGYPEGHVESPSKERDLDYLKLKVDQGAEFIITNYSYDNRCFFDFFERCRATGISIPILPGVMPIYSVKMMKTLAGICGASIPEEVMRGIERIGENDKEGLTEFGIEFAVRQCEELLKSGMPGVHIYTLDRSESALGIIRELRASGLFTRE